MLATLVRTGATVSIALAFATAMLLPVSPASAANAEAGKRLTERWCVSCHSPSSRSRTSDVAAPSFNAVVNRRKRTESQLRAWLSDPHPPMPQLNLTRDEIDDIVAYLEELRKR